MIRKEIENIAWLEFELFSPFKNLTHGVLLRHGGFSQGAYQSLNMGFSSTNEMENQNVTKNREKVQKIFDLTTLYDSYLEHENQIMEITKDNRYARYSCDAVATRLLHQPLLVTHADCQAAIFYDPIHHVISNVHAGWRGNVQDIYGETVKFMKHQFGSSPANLHVCISPSLGPHDSQFINYRTELPQPFWQFQVKPLYFDLWEISKQQLKKAGVLEHHIQIAEISTLSNPQDYFSYRREKASGRHGTFVVLK